MRMAVTTCTSSSQINPMNIHNEVQALNSSVELEAKVKKHRRGKKLRKTRPYDMELEAEVVSSNTYEMNNNDKSRSLPRGGGLRPRYSPQAPRNYTQYIIDDQLRCSEGSVRGEDQQLDVYLAAQFEVEFKQHQEAELATKSRNELQSLVYDLRSRVSALEDWLLSCSSCNAVLMNSLSSDDGDSDTGSDSSHVDTDSDLENHSRSADGVQHLVNNGNCSIDNNNTNSTTSFRHEPPSPN